MWTLRAYFCYFDSCKCESELSFLYSPPISMISGVNVVSPHSCMRTVSLRSSTIIFSKLGPKGQCFYRSYELPRVLKRRFYGSQN